MEQSLYPLAHQKTSVSLFLLPMWTVWLFDITITGWIYMPPVNSYFLTPVTQIVKIWQTQQYSGRKPHPQARIPRSTANLPLSAAVLLLIKLLKFLVLLFRWETSKAAQELGSGSSGDVWEYVTDWCFHFQTFLPESSASLTTFFFFFGPRSLCLINWLDFWYECTQPSPSVSPLCGCGCCLEAVLRCCAHCLHHS